MEIRYKYIGIKEYDRQGYAHLQELIRKKPIAEIAEIFALCIYDRLNRLGKGGYSSRYDGVAYLYKHDYPAFLNILRLLENSIPVLNLATDPTVLGAVSTIAGIKAPALSTKPVVMYHSKACGDYSTDWHVDSYSIQGSSNCAVLWIPLNSMTKSNGILQVATGTHKEHTPISDFSEGFGTVDVKDLRGKLIEDVAETLDIGDAVLFNSDLVHKSGDMREGVSRMTLQLRYNDILDTEYMERGWPNPYKYYPERLYD